MRCEGAQAEGGRVHFFCGHCVVQILTQVLAITGPPVPGAYQELGCVGTMMTRRPENDSCRSGFRKRSDHRVNGRLTDVACSGLTVHFPSDPSSDAIGIILAATPEIQGGDPSRHVHQTSGGHWSFAGKFSISIFSVPKLSMYRVFLLFAILVGNLLPRRSLLSPSTSNPQPPHAERAS